VHAASINDLGGVVAGAFEHPESVGAGAYLSSANAPVSFEDFADELRSQGHSIAILEVPPTVYATFYPGADEMAQMMTYWAAHTYLGPTADEAITAGAGVNTTPPTEFATWAARYMEATTR